MHEEAVTVPRTRQGVRNLYAMRILLERYATYAGADPRRAPAALLAIPYAEMRYGGWYLRGGLRTLADALLARCDELGVRVHTGTPVGEIETGGSRVHGVRLSGGSSDHVLWHMHADFSALGWADIQKLWLTFAPALANGSAYSSTEWQVTVSNWAVSDSAATRALKSPANS